MSKTGLYFGVEKKLVCILVWKKNRYEIIDLFHVHIRFVACCGETKVVIVDSFHV